MELLKAAADQNRWGKKKKNYYAGDTADLEIGQDIEDAIDEEAAAIELNTEKLKRMKDSDFYDDFNKWNEEEEDEDDEQAEKKSKKKSKKLAVKTKDIVAKQLEELETSMNETSVLDKVT